ncbi:MAG TPA: Fe-S cluster assembly ATPase SufC [Candidatus Saccharimonadales bacterium]|nr:Fe-S cluster assembly ATPase SufC [Candidatus Saccharimonadales bacterium]
MLKVKNLHVNIGDKEILKGVDLEFAPNKVYALMGQNGSGKSTLAQALMGHPQYLVTSGSVVFGGKNLLELDPTSRGREGIFLSFQYPSEIPGVTISSFLRMIYNKSHNTNMTPVNFRKLLKEKMEMLDIKEDFMNRYLNDGFSGGEKKRMEMLQMLVLEPKLAILDETDSGLDIDALNIVAKAVNSLKDQTKMTVLIITHYTRILEHIVPDEVLVMQDGQIVKKGGKELAHELEAKGYAEYAPVVNG